MHSPSHQRPHRGAHDIEHSADHRSHERQFSGGVGGNHERQFSGGGGGGGAGGGNALNRSGTLLEMEEGGVTAGARGSHYIFPVRKSYGNIVVMLLLLEGFIIVLFMCRDGWRASADLDIMLREHPRDGPILDKIPLIGFISHEKSKQLRHLIMVPGHAITTREALDGADHEDFIWYLLDYQRHKDVPTALVDHIREGVRLAAADPHSLLMFSGGQTRTLAGPRSEAESYYFVANHYGWWGHPEVKARTALEDYARDSFQNLLFAACRFQEITGHHPFKYTVVGFSFKKQRYSDHHRAAIRYPAEHFHYVGLNPPHTFDLAAAVAGEKATAEQFAKDPYGCTDPVLVQKKDERNPFARTDPYRLSCPALTSLLEWCETDLFGGSLAWDLRVPKGGTGTG